MSDLKAYAINIGPRGEPRLSFGVMAYSSSAAQEQHEDLAEPGERVEAFPLRAEPATLNAARHQLEEAKLREVPAWPFPVPAKVAPARAVSQPEPSPVYGRSCTRCAGTPSGRSHRGFVGTCSCPGGAS